MSRSAKAQATIYRAQLRAIYRALATLPSKPEPVTRKAGTPAPFVQCWAVSRGYSSITQALDADGQVWERVSQLENKVLVDSWWEPLTMTRKGPAKKGKP